MGKIQYLKNCDVSFAQKICQSPGIRITLDLGGSMYTDSRDTEVAMLKKL